MRVLLLTVAGTSSRFSASVGHPCLKCIYQETDIRDSLLYRMLKREADFDRIVVVGGFMFELLKETLYDTILPYFPGLSEKLLLVENPKFAEYGSGYSLCAGLDAISDVPYDELVFAEGDLFVDDEIFGRVVHSRKDVLTLNTEPIRAEKAVLFYLDEKETPHYVYDVSHGLLHIDEPFRAVYNSGQIWKFCDVRRLKEITAGLSEEEKQGTNLVLVNRYFAKYGAGDLELLCFRKWLNCNTVEDYRRIKEMEQDDVK